MDAVRHRFLRSAAVGGALVVLTVGCGGEPATLVGVPVSDEVADLTVVPDDRSVVLGEQYPAVRVPVEIVAGPGPTTLTVEALRTAGHPRALWQSLLTHPAGAPA